MSVVDREHQPPLEWVRPPLQARSQQTLQRLLDGAEALINDEGIENVTVAEIARRAGSSVGAFYTRFADKEALVRCVLERFSDQAVATAEEVLQHDRWDGVPVRDALQAMMTFTLRILNERRGIIVALVVRATRDPEMTAIGDRLHEHIALAMHRLIASRRHRVAHPDPETAIHAAVWMVLSSLESRVLYATRDREKKLSDEDVAREIAQMIVAYVGINED